MRFFIFLFVIGVYTIFLYAKGTLSGEHISNQASLVLTIEDKNYSVVSNAEEFVVDRVVDIKLFWQDNAPIRVSSNEKNRVLTFLLSNLGNAKDTITLTTLLDSNKSFVPAPAHIRLYEDSNQNGFFDANDTLSSQISLEADQNRSLFIVADILEGNYTINASSFVGIRASSLANATTEADRANQVDIVLRNKEQTSFGVYKIKDCWLEAKHLGEVLSEDNKTHTGSLIEYTIELSIGGNNKGKTISDITIRDNIDSKSIYVPNSLRLNDTPLKDSEHFVDNTIIVSNLSLSNDEKKRLQFRVQVQ